LGALEGILEEIKVCDKCCNVYPKYAEVIDPREKACIKFRVFEDWLPKRVRTLFIAESPPWARQRYFYNECMEDGLRAGLLRLLKIRDLKTFKERGNFLIDAVKCRFNKRGMHIPRRVIYTCSRSYLRKEIDALRPERIFLLGKTALIGLQAAFRDSSLGKYKNVIESCGAELNVSGYDVIIGLYPSDQNRRYYYEMRKAFGKLTEGRESGP